MLTSLFAQFKKIDKTLVSVISILLVFGLVVLYDATAIPALEIYGNSYGFVLLQLAWILVGVVGFGFFYLLPLKNLRKLSIPLFFAALIVLVVLAIFGALPCDLNFAFAPCIKGANRWFYLNPAPLPELPFLGVLGFQPSDLAKFAMVLFLGGALEKSLKEKNDPYYVFLTIAGFVSFCIFLQPNFSTAALVFAIGVAMFFALGTSIKKLLISIPIIGVVGVLFMVSSTYRRERIATFLASDGGGEALSSGYHIKQILIALGSGGFWGLGLGQSRQKFQFLPEVFADSIFAIIGEELGFIGTSFLVCLYSFFIYKGYKIAMEANDIYSKLLAVGFTTWISLQFFINIAAMTKVIPLTGVPLPLISYGGSSMVFILMGLGVLANISRNNTFKR